MLKGAISISREDRKFEFRNRELLFLDAVVIDAEKVSLIINKGVGVDSFQEVQGYDQLQRNSHGLASN